MQWPHQQRGQGGYSERGLGRENKSPERLCGGEPQSRIDMGPSRHRNNSSWVIHKTTLAE